MLDETDSRLLAAVQAQAQITAQELGDLLKLSASQAARRRAKLEADGLITGYSARLSPSGLGLTVQAFVQVQMAAHSPEAAKGFLRLIATLPEVTACWTLTGKADYLVRRSACTQHTDPPPPAAEPRCRACAKPDRDGSAETRRGAAGPKEHRTSGRPRHQTAVDSQACPARLM
jgi:DNA-binding Lrp family transcriptional regulator